MLKLMTLYAYGIQHSQQGHSAIGKYAHPHIGNAQQAQYHHRQFDSQRHHHILPNHHRVLRAMLIAVATFSGLSSSITTSAVSIAASLPIAPLLFPHQPRQALGHR